MTLPTKHIDEMVTSSHMNYSELDKVCHLFLDSNTGVKMDSLLDLVGGSVYGFRNYAKKRLTIRVSILKDSEGIEYVFFKSTEDDEE